MDYMPTTGAFVVAPSVATSTPLAPTTTAARRLAEFEPTTGFGATSSAVAKTVGLTVAALTVAAAGRRAQRHQRKAQGIRAERSRRLAMAAHERQEEATTRLCNSEDDLTPDEEDCVVPPECVGRDLVNDEDGKGGKNRREAVANALAFVGFNWRKQPEAGASENENSDCALGGALVRDGL
eukprot:TRINITY_DN69478_c0_g1_i1.p2 TRINITY_DN69478_c0_g1~~TRINITY_DN69478_c0_g1_i1.p2  ORF type:complete len:181 (+),score=47.73 TRINITY_DN69478_c0_g1_i1:150-692(+)